MIPRVSLSTGGVTPHGRFFPLFSFSQYGSGPQSHFLAGPPQLSHQMRDSLFPPLDADSADGFFLSGSVSASSFVQQSLVHGINLACGTARRKEMPAGAASAGRAQGASWNKLRTTGSPTQRDGGCPRGCGETRNCQHSARGSCTAVRALPGQLNARCLFSRSSRNATCGYDPFDAVSWRSGERCRSTTSFWSFD